MLNSTVLDVVIGLVFCFASVALIASYLYETGASLLKLRASTLLRGVKDLLNDQQLSGLARDLYNHAQVNPRSDGKTATGERPKILPSYIDPRAFAIAMVDSIQALPGGVADLGSKINSFPDAQIRLLLQGMYERGNKEIGNFQSELSKWFEAGMERVSGSYKRWAQLFTFLIALVVAALLNIDTFHLFRALWEHPMNGQQFAASGVASTAVNAVKTLQTLPVGWTGRIAWDPLAWCGWLVTASTALFGAPFWFNLLNRLGNIRGAGPSPNEKK
jgi:hypothetical protein